MRLWHVIMLLKAINGMQPGRHCNPCCPRRDAFINTINQLMVEIKDTEPECFQRLMLELENSLIFAPFRPL